MSQWVNRIAVVTGAAQGIGASCVKEFVKSGIIAVGIDKLGKRMEDIKALLPSEQQARFHPIVCDVTDKQQVNDTFDNIIAKFGGVDLLVNSAGVHYFGMLCEVDMAIVDEVMQTNVNSIVHCTQRAFKSMRERNGEGHILMMNSISGHKVLPVTFGVSNMYMPSKFALTAMVEVLRQEFRELGTRVKVTNVCPGVANTDMVPENYKEILRNRMLDVDDITQLVMAIINTPPNVQVSDITIKAHGETH